MPKSKYLGNNTKSRPILFGDPNVKHLNALANSVTGNGELCLIIEQFYGKELIQDFPHFCNCIGSTKPKITNGLRLRPGNDVPLTATLSLESGHLEILTASTKSLQKYQREMLETVVFQLGGVAQKGPHFYQVDGLKLRDQGVPILVRNLDDLMMAIRGVGLRA